jgi:uracil-DNA glycosylase
MWTERQRAMLQAMGLHLHLPALMDDPTAAVPAAAKAAPASVPETDHPPAYGGGIAPAQSAGEAPAHAYAGRASRSDAAPAPPVVLPAALAALDWPALREAVAACRACSLCETRKQTVFGVGHPQAQWMVVGEAPGAEEDARGEPFVGRAGQLLDAMLRALQLTRAVDGDLAAVPAERRVYIANTLKCRPPGNRNPQPDELARCEPFLVRQIELLRPRLILAMGRFAVQALLRSNEPIGKLRGRVHQYQGVPLVVSYHPAYLLRNPADKGKAWDDLCLAAEVAGAGQAEIAARPHATQGAA